MKNSHFDFKKEYIVDVTKEPIFPPGRLFRESFLFGEIETKESVAQTKKWNEYIKKYGEELKNKS